MPKPKQNGGDDVRVDDPAAAFNKLESFTRRIMAVPKKRIDSMRAKEKAKKRPRP
jgi:hypothetical protein